MIPRVNLTHFEPDEDGNAKTFSAVHIDDFLYVHELGWMYNTGTYWERDKSTLRTRKAAFQLLRNRREAFIREGKWNQQDVEVATEASNARSNGLLNAAQTHMYACIEAFNVDPDVINVKNGVLDLPTLTLTPHDPLKDHFTYCSPANWNPDADMSGWTTFLDQVVATTVKDPKQRQEILDFLQLYAGYSLTGYTNEEVAVYLFGPSRSGKGTTMETLHAVFPDPLSAFMEFATLAQKRDASSQNFDLAPLQPCRMVFASEGNRHHTLDAAKLKHMTGGDFITCSYKFKDTFSYRPQYKLWLASNWPVHLDPDDHAAWGRLALVEYPTSYYGHEDKKLKRRMKQKKNLEGVLRWCAEGAQKWYTLENGLVIPEHMRVVLRKQRLEQDYIGQWIEDCCEVDNAAFEKHEYLHLSYKSWCQVNGVEPRAKNAFSLGLTSKGFTAGRQSVGGKQARGFIGLQLTAEATKEVRRIQYAKSVDGLTEVMNEMLN